MRNIKLPVILSSLVIIAAACTEAKTKLISSKYSEPEVAKIVETVNDGEVALARRALAVSDNTEVKKFAQSMIDDHTKNNQKTEQLASGLGMSPETSDHSEALMKRSEKSMKNLNQLSGKDFDKAYISDQIATHEMVLADLNKSLIPSAKDEKLKAHLRMTAHKVQDHLDHAKEIQKTL